MDEAIKSLRYLFKYRNSPLFKNELYVNEANFLGWFRVPNGDIEKFTNTHIKELVSRTGLNKKELKKVLGKENYYNLLLFLFDVNNCLTNLISKNNKIKNYIIDVINRKKKENLFKNLNKHKVSNILSLFSEIVCSSIMMSGRNEFIISGNKYQFEYKRDGPFDIILKSGQKGYFFDVKRMTFEKNLDAIDDKYIENKLKEKLENICEKARGIDPPVFLIIDCSDMGVLEKYVGVDSTTNNPLYEVAFIGKKIVNILKKYIDSNKSTFKDLEKVAGVGLFFWMLGISRKPQEFKLIFWHIPFTNPHSKFYNNEIIQINNIDWKALKEEHDRIMPSTGGIEILGFGRI